MGSPVTAWFYRFATGFRNSTLLLSEQTKRMKRKLWLRFYFNPTTIKNIYG